MKSIIKKLVGHTEESLNRVVMNQTTLRWMKDLPTEKMDAVEISGLSWKQKCPFQSYQSAWFPEFDICKAPLAEPVDLILAEQVWEHIPSPFKATQHVFHSLKPGGYFLVTVPFLMRIHLCPLDCTRWTPQGLRFLLEEAGFESETMRVDAWGNAQAVRAAIHGRNYCKRLHSLKNNPNLPVSVWALARKPSMMAM